MKKYAWVATLLLAPLVGAFGNRQRGTDSEKRFLRMPKPAIYAAFAAIDTLLLAGVCATVYGLPAYYAAPVVFLCAWAATFFGFAASWGELFMHLDKDTSQEECAAGVRSITTRIVGFDHTPELWANKEHGKILLWKRTGMCVRWALYFAPKYVLFSLLSASPLPLLGIPAMYYVGHIYDAQFGKQRKHPQGALGYNAVEHAELWVGAYKKFVDVLLLAGASLLNLSFLWS